MMEPASDYAVHRPNGRQDFLDTVERAIEVLKEIRADDSRWWWAEGGDIPAPSEHYREMAKRMEWVAEVVGKGAAAMLREADEDAEAERLERKAAKWIAEQHAALCHPDGEPCPDGCDAGPVYCQCSPKMSFYRKAGSLVCAKCARAIH